MDYCGKLRKSAELYGNCVCMGIDPIIREPQEIIGFFSSLLEAMKRSSLIPAAFKPNLGFFSCLDQPREGSFSGSMALASILDVLGELFPEVPVILDAKRGDIARSSLNYAEEAFDCWKTDSVTISPYMGQDSVLPFAFEGKGAYILTRTSNPGGKDLQNLPQQSGELLFEKVAEKVIAYNKQAMARGASFGAVLGATNLGELERAASIFSTEEVPLLIPGVGSQGGSAPEVMAALKRSSYDCRLARINSSSSLTHPWKSPVVPPDGIGQCLENIGKLMEECRC